MRGMGKLLLTTLSKAHDRQPNERLAFLYVAVKGLSSRRRWILE
jgi:hypothetical protein